MLTFYEKWISGTNNIDKNVTVVLPYFCIFVFPLCHHGQNCNYSTNNEVIGLEFSGNV